MALRLILVFGASSETGRRPTAGLGMRQTGTDNGYVLYTILFDVYIQQLATTVKRKLLL